MNCNKLEAYAQKARRDFIAAVTDQAAFYGLTARSIEHATTFGSLIQVPEGLAAKLPALKHLSEATSQDIFESDALRRLASLVQQAELLAGRYDAVVANPPYMGSKGMNALVKKFARDHFPDAKGDFFACFIERGFTLARDAGHNAMVTMQSWMFLSSFQKMRERMLREKTIVTMAHMANGVMGIAFGTAATVLRNFTVSGYIADYSHTSVDDLSDQRVPSEFPVRNNRLKRVAQDEFKKIPGSPVAYWVSEALRNAFLLPRLGDDVADIRQGMATTDNLRFLRTWPEVAIDRIQFGDELEARIVAPDAHWFPYNKGGPFRKWYGNNVVVLDYADNGEVLIKLVRQKYPRISDPEFVIKNRKYYFRPCASWSDVTSGALSARYVPKGYTFDTVGPSAFSKKDELEEIYFFAALLNSNVSARIIPALNPTLHFNLENAKSLPVASGLTQNPQLFNLVDRLIVLARTDWNAYERSWDFQSLPILTASSEPTPTLESSYTAWITQNHETIAEMKRLEEENNRLFIDAYGLTDELTPDVSIEQITLTVNPAYRYGGKFTEEEQWTRFL